MIKKTANYANTTHNFVFQNIKKCDDKPLYYPAICILKNILQRGKPTRLSSFLQSKLGQIHLSEDFDSFTPLISGQNPKWNNLIRGDVYKNNFPARYFYDTLIPQYFEEYPFIQQLIAPEVPINFITQVEVEEFIDQQVDFYLPQASLVIEIDGVGHDKTEDEKRDVFLKKYGIETIRFTTNEVNNQGIEFLSKIDLIKKRIINISKFIDEKINNNKKNDNTLIEYVPSINDYKKAFDLEIFNSENKYLKVTAIIRFQLLIIELIENSILTINDDLTFWEFEVKTDTKFDFISLALDDLIQWIKNILQLHKVKHDKIDYKFTIVDEFSEKNNLKIDFSLFQRYTDFNLTDEKIIFVRNDYFDFYLNYEVNSINEIKFIQYSAIDYFIISASPPINYNFNFDNTENCDKRALSFFLENIFGYNSFRDGQIQIIANCLRGNSTIGLLPTGGGKSICFQLPIFLQPGISFVVCPIKSLMFDQKVDLNKLQITRVEHLTSNDKGRKKEAISRNFQDGKYQFLFISPERFQQKVFRDYLTTIQKKFQFIYAVIDEVHCLSEWGHDFRVSYLNLAKSINKFTSDEIRYIALTATASIKVLEDIKIELKIKSENVVTLTEYSRPELEFEVISDEKNKYRTLKLLLDQLIDKYNFSKESGDDSDSGIIFTNSVNGKDGCFQVSKKLSIGLNFPVEYFSGQAPRDVDKDEFEKYKEKVQNDFKNNDLPLLLATKAFGMGVNKKNVSFTIHYGIPGSMESLYQEAGRAGRDKERYIVTKAKSYVLFAEHTDEEDIGFLWNQSTSIEELKEKCSKLVGDLNSNVYLMTSSLEDIQKEFRIIREFYLMFIANNKEKFIFVSTKKFIFRYLNVNKEEVLISVNKDLTEKTIYRLVQLGVINDWTVENYHVGDYTIEINDYSINSIYDSLKYTIEKYDSNSIFDELISVDFKNNFTGCFEFELNDFDYLILRLLYWINDHFLYNRRQSLKNVYQVCQNFIHSTDDESTKKLDLKNTLESYFKFNESSYVLQYISENGLEFKRWFEVFQRLDGKQSRTDEVISLSEVLSLQSNLNRFLESYAANIGLNFISGIVRLLNDDFEDSDGRIRIQSSIDYIKSSNHFSSEDVTEIVKQSCNIIRTFNMKHRNVFSEFLIHNFDSNNNLLFIINEILEDEFSTQFLIQSANYKLTSLNNQIHEQYKGII
jgi:ATP-dependent DNA helicase RecQ